MDTEPKIIVPDLPTAQPTEIPITEKTRAILIKLEQIEAKLNRYQNVTDAVRQIQEDQKRWKSVTYRLLKEAISLFFSDKENHKR